MTNKNDTQEPQFQIHKLYIKDVTFQVPEGILAFQNEWNPNLSVDLDYSTNNLPEKDSYEVILKIKTKVESGDKAIFNVEVHQAGIFTVSNIEKSQLEHALGSYCPNILYPYAREVISDIIMKGGFPQLCLAPINFDLLYQKKLEEKNKTATA